MFIGRETQSYVVDAIVNLLREAEQPDPNPIEPAMQPIVDNSNRDFMPPRVRNNSRYGILLLKELCQPRKTPEIAMSVKVGRLSVGCRILSLKLYFSKHFRTCEVLGLLR